VIEEKEYFSTGSGSPMALGVLEDRFPKNMSLEEAKKVVANAIYSATKRDIASGGSGIDITVVDSRGVHELSDEEVKSLSVIEVLHSFHSQRFCNVSIDFLTPMDA